MNKSRGAAKRCLPELWCASAAQIAKARAARARVRMRSGKMPQGKSPRGEGKGVQE